MPGDINQVKEEKVFLERNELKNVAANLVTWLKTPPNFKRGYIGRLTGNQRTLNLRSVFQVLVKLGLPFVQRSIKFVQPGCCF